MQLTQTLRLLRWLYAGRLTIALSIYAAAVWAWTDAPSDTTLVASLGVLLAIGVSVASVWATEVAGLRPTANFLYGQILFDTLLVTAVVHITTIGELPSDFSPLYVPVIAAASVLLPLPGGLLIGGLCSILYVADVLWLQPYAVSLATLQQCVLFVVLAGVTALLGHRLRRTDRALGAAELQLRQLRLDIDEMLAAIDTGLVTLDSAGRLVHLNPAAESLLLVRGSDWLGRSILDELNRNAPGLGDVVERVARTGVAQRRTEIRAPRAEGDVFFNVRTTWLERPEGACVVAVVQDVTESRQIDDLIRRAERLQAIAELGASLAHEIKNPLASIRSSVEQLAADRLQHEDRTTLRRLILAESDRLTRMLSEFMEFSRVELRRWRTLDLRDIASEAIDLVAQHPDTGEGTKIDLLAPPDPVIVDGDEDLLHRAVFNLVLNGVQHAGPSGRVHVELGRVDALDLPASVLVHAPVRLSVHDSGPGIRDEDLSHLFDPFFTTRSGGSGLGLAMVHRAIEAHRGAILVDNQDGAGARFTIYLPAHNGHRN
ncbi:MAG: ATP-binding protein [Gemmatimonadetes bacterium]|nr:ATP-binding protein [Gemmatimonadota bacterium]